MCSEGIFCLMQLSEIAYLRECIERRFAADARTLSQTTSKICRERPSMHHTSHLPDATQGYNLDAITRSRILPNSVGAPLPSLMPVALHRQQPELIRAIIEVSDCDIAPSSRALWKIYSKACPSPTACTKDIDFEAAASIFRIWRSMFDTDGRLSCFNIVVQMKNRLSLKITYHAASDEVVPGFGMIFSVVGADETACRRLFFGLFNYSWFKPERFTLGMLQCFTQQLAQLITARVGSSSPILDIVDCDVDQRDRHHPHPQKRPALEK
jgi:hypothetical protein